MRVKVHAISPQVELLYAIGDVHGRADLLKPLLAALRDASGPRRAAVVFLGDLVDRGPESCEVLDLVGEMLDAFPDSVLCRGNHDDWFLRFLQGDGSMSDELDVWLEQGGAETLRSYAVERATVADIRARILDRFPHHLARLQDAALLATWRDFAFVHAGLDPTAALDDQTAETCLWIRAPFLRHVGPLEDIVVHGHSPQKPARPHVTENRISLDTGAFFSGVLTAAVFDAARATLQFVAASRGGRVRLVDPVRVDRGLGTVLSDEIDADGDGPTFLLPQQKRAALRPPNLAGVSGHEKPDTS